MHTRRNFIKKGAIGAISMAAGPSLLQLFKGAEKKLTQFGVQLYMVKEDMARDPKSTLKALAQYGYQQIESFEGDKGMFSGLGNKGFTQYIGDLGMKLVSSHYNDDDNEVSFKKKADLAQAAGLTYLITPWMKHQETMDDWKKNAEHLNRYGKICKERGLKYAFHGEVPAFKKIDGQIPEDYVLDHTDKELVDFQMDLYYVYDGGYDVEGYLKKYSHRFKLSHLRDRLKIHLPANSPDESAADLGQGSLDLDHIFRTALDNGMEYFFVEQSRFDKSTPLQSAEKNAAFLKQYIASQK